MRSRFSIWLSVLLTAFFVSTASAEATVTMTPLRVTDIGGVTRTLPDPKAKATVLIFIAHDCPISNSYAPEISRLAAQYAPLGIAFDLVYAEPALTAAQAQAHAKEYGYHLPALTASWQTLVGKTGVTTTPEAAVLSRRGDLLYRGRINDLFTGFGIRRPQATTPDLKAALEDIVHDRPVQVARTKAVGCFIAR